MHNVNNKQFDVQDLARQFQAQDGGGGADPPVRPRDGGRDRGLQPDAAPTVRLLVGNIAHNATAQELLTLFRDNGHEIRQVDA